MPDEQYSIQEFAAKIRQRRPDLANIPDMTLVGKTIAAAPELKQYLKTEDVGAASANQPWYKTMFNQDKQTPQQLSARTPGQVASDQAANVITGIPQAVTGIPSTVAALAKLGYKSLTGDATGAVTDAANVVKGVVAPVVTPAKQAIELAKPGLVTAPTPDAPETAASAQGAGAMLGGVLATEGVKAVAPSVINAAKARLNAPPADPVAAIEQKITGGKSASTATAPHIADIAPELAKDPDLVAAKPGEPFRQTLFNKLQDAGQNVRTEEAAIPDSTPVPKQPILDGLKTLKDQLDRSQATKASAIVQAKIDQIEGMSGGKTVPDITWGEFSPVKQQLGQDLREMGVWKRLGTDAQKTTDMALARSYGQYMKATSAVSQDLADANARFSLLHDAARFSKIDPTTGRYLPEVGQKPVTAFDKIKPWAIGLGVSGAAGSAGYSLYRALTSP